MARMHAQQAPLFEQVANMKMKLQLMEADRKSYYDTTFQKLIKEHEKLTKLRANVKNLRQELREKSNPDEYITDQALQRHPIDRHALMKYESIKAIEIMDHHVCDKLKRLNALKHKTLMKREHLHDMEEKYTQMLIFVAEMEDEKARRGKSGQKVREIENKLDKATLKQNEAEHVRESYIKIKDMLKQEAITYNLTLSTIESEIIKSQKELVEVKTIYKDAEFSRNRDLMELRRHEEFIMTEMKRRELELNNMKKLAASKSFQNISNKVNTPIVMSLGESMHVPNDDDRSDRKSSCDDNNAIQLKKNEELFQIIKESTGLSSLNQMVKRFQSQVNTHNSLTELKTNCEEDIETAREEKKKLIMDLLNLRYIIDEKSAKHSLSKIEKDTKLVALRAEMEDSLKAVTAKQLLLAKIRFGIEHIANKCEKKIDKNSDFMEVKTYIRLLDKIYSELTLYLGELKDYNVKDELIKMHEEDEEILLVPTELNVIIESKLNSHNTRIKTILSNVPKENQLNDSDSEQDDKITIYTREALKKQSFKISDSKMKKRIVNN